MKISKYIPRSILNRLLSLASVRIQLRESSLSTIINSILRDKRIEKDGYVLSNYGVWMYKNYDDKTYNLNIIGYRNKLDRHIKSLDEPFVFIDFGSNQGIFSILAGKNRFCRRIHLFEPNPRITDILVSNLNHNNIFNYEIHKYAISNVIGKIPFSVPEGHTGAAHITRQNEESTFSLYVDSINKDYLSNIENNFVEPIFLKIDVEGSEYVALTEIFCSSLLNRIKYIFVELNSALSNTEKILKLLKDFGFTELNRKGSKDSYDALYLKQ